MHCHQNQLDAEDSPSCNWHAVATQVLLLFMDEIFIVAAL